MRAHFEAIAEAAPELPLVLDNIPSRVVINMEPDFLGELSSIDSVVAVKQSNDDELGPIEGLAALTGNDDTFLATLEFGGAGGVPGCLTLVGGRMRDCGTPPRAETWSGLGRSMPACARCMRGWQSRPTRSRSRRRWR